MFYLYTKNRIVFIVLFSLSTLLIVEGTMFFVYDEKPKIISILIELPFFVIGAWLYHYKMTQRIANRTTKK